MLDEAVAGLREANELAKYIDSLERVYGDSAFVLAKNPDPPEAVRVPHISRIRGMLEDCISVFSTAVESPPRPPSFAELQHLEAQCASCRSRLSELRASLESAEEALGSTDRLPTEVRLAMPVSLASRLDEERSRLRHLEEQAIEAQARLESAEGQLTAAHSRLADAEYLRRATARLGEAVELSFELTHHLSRFGVTREEAARLSAEERARSARERQALEASRRRLAEAQTARERERIEVEQFLEEERRRSQRVVRCVYCQLPLAADGSCYVCLSNSS